MFTLFSIIFTAIFIAFIVATIIGHVMLIDALIRPFFAKLALSHRLAPRRHRPLRAAR